MYRKELHEIRQAVITIETDLTAAITTIPENVATDIQSTKQKIRALREALVGAENTRYHYDCQKAACKQKCKLDLGVKLEDLTFCMDSLQTGEGQFILTFTETVT